MDSIANIISDLEYARSIFLKSIEGLSRQELTQKTIYPEWTIKDVLAHIVGWDERVINTLPLILQDRASEVPGVEVEEFNQQSVRSRRDKTFIEILVEAQAKHQQILNILSSTDYIEIDKRHERNGRIITIRSYVLDIMVEHERQHAVEIEQWRKTMERTIDPAAIKVRLEQNRAEFMTSLDQLAEAEILAKGAVGSWSISDLVGHLADWEKRLLQGAYHIHDRAVPPVPPMATSIDDWNETMVVRRAEKSWPENYHDLVQIQSEVDRFVAELVPGDWRLRGPYPWPNDQGTLAELIGWIATHYEQHQVDVEQAHGRHR